MKLNKLNIMDIATVSVVVLLVAIGAIYYLRQPIPEATKMNVTVEITDTAQVAAIWDIAKASKTVYLNSVNVPVESTAMLLEQALQLTLTGPGHADENGFYYFNGQRLLIGQKAEIHGSYFAQGKITKIENAN